MIIVHLAIRPPVCVHSFVAGPSFIAGRTLRRRPSLRLVSARRGPRLRSAAGRRSSCRRHRTWERRRRARAARRWQWARARRARAARCAALRARGQGSCAAPRRAAAARVPAAAAAAVPAPPPRAMARGSCAHHLPRGAQGRGAGLHHLLQPAARGKGARPTRRASVRRRDQAPQQRATAATAAPPSAQCSHAQGRRAHALTHQRRRLRCARGLRARAAPQRQRARRRPPHACARRARATSRSRAHARPPPPLRGAHGPRQRHEPRAPLAPPRRAPPLRLPRARCACTLRLLRRVPVKSAVGVRGGGGG